MFREVSVKDIPSKGRAYVMVSGMGFARDQTRRAGWWRENCVRPTGGREAVGK